MSGAFVPRGHRGPCQEQWPWNPRTPPGGVPLPGGMSTGGRGGQHPFPQRAGPRIWRRSACCLSGRVRGVRAGLPGWGCLPAHGIATTSGSEKALEDHCDARETTWTLCVHAWVAREGQSSHTWTPAPSPIWREVARLGWGAGVGSPPDRITAAHAHPCTLSAYGMPPRATAMPPGLGGWGCSIGCPHRAACVPSGVRVQQQVQTGWLGGARGPSWVRTCTRRGGADLTAHAPRLRHRTRGVLSECAPAS